MIIVSDTSCIINLAVIGQLDLLHKLFNEVVIPNAVYNEIVVLGEGKPGSQEVENADWIIRKSCHDKQLLNELIIKLDEGESEAIVLALELNATLLLIDEEKGRLEASRLHVPYTGLLGVLLSAKRKGLITEVKALMIGLRKLADFRISDKLFKEVLRLANENI